ncbi:MAG: DUF1326 domain-containing protein [Alphaproteobacteria bacterium]|nr:DUF1326 domain-containing protein [Alphaproteobacteria bacterium]
MVHLDWKIRTVKLATCSCDYGCPCEFNAPPTRRPCEGFEASEIIEGHFGDMRLDRLRFGATFRWPGPLHEGGGTAQGIIDERADQAQREAIIKILSGEEQEPTTMFNIIGGTIAAEEDTLYLPIDMAWDMAARSGHIDIPGVAKGNFEPIRNPVTGKPHYAKITLNDGFEFHEAEMASADAEGTGEIKFNCAGRYAFLIDVSYGPHGIIA